MSENWYLESWPTDLKLLLGKMRVNSGLFKSMKVKIGIPQVEQTDLKIDIR